jgi:hypothetical protein
MKNSNTTNQRIANMTFASVYPMYLEKVEKKGRTKEELHQVIEWLTDFDDKKLQKLIKENATFETFFQQASLNPNAHLITGVICGVRVEEIENPLTQQARYLDKLVDELAKGRTSIRFHLEIMCSASIGESSTTPPPNNACSGQVGTHRVLQAFISL